MRCSVRSRLILAGLASLLVLAACGVEPGENTAQQAVQPAVTTPDFARQVRVIQAEHGDLTLNRSVTVTVEAERESVVASGASGRVSEVLVTEGSDVVAGQDVLRLEDEQLAFQVDNARLALSSAQVNLSRAQSASTEGSSQAAAAEVSARLAVEMMERSWSEALALHEIGAISRSDLDAIESQLAQARAQYGQAADAVARASRAQGEDLRLLQLQVDQARTQLAQAESQLAETVITAPFDGTVTTLMVNPGEFVGAGSPVFRLVGSGPQLARFSVPIEDAPALLEQGMIYIRYQGLDYAAQVRPGTFTANQARMASMTAAIHDSETKIPNGAVAQFGYVSIPGSGDLIPGGAIRLSGSTPTVLVVVDGVVESAAVSLVAESAGTAAVRGLPPEAQIVYPLPADLLPGTKVEIVD